MGQYDYDEEFDDKRRRESTPLNRVEVWFLTVAAAVLLGPFMLLDALLRLRRRR